MIQVKNLTFSYNGQDEALKNVNLTIKKGSFTAIIGHNGSGKSTLAKCLVGLLRPSEGDIAIDEVSLTESNIQSIRKKIGIVFQNPDNQFVGVTVRHDIAFGLENQRIASREMESRVLMYAKKVGMENFLNKEPHQLSGGQKQRVAIASALAMEQDIIILDEATSMLDPEGVKNIMDIVEALNKEDKKTIIMITHDLRLAKHADQIIVMKNGETIAEGKPEDIYNNSELLSSTQLLLPFELELYQLAQNNQGISKAIKEALWAYNFKK